MPPGTVEALNTLCEQGSADLTWQQSGQLRELLFDYWDIFAIKDQDRGRTGMVQHDIDTGDARPIRVHPVAWPGVSKRRLKE